MSELIELHIQPPALAEVRDQDGGLIQITSELGSPFAVAAQAAAAQAAAHLDEFTNLYLGARTAHPVTDNDGNPLQNGALYLNTANDQLWFYDAPGGTWIPAGGSTASAIQYTPHGPNTATDVQGAIAWNTDQMSERLAAPSSAFSGNCDTITQSGLYPLGASAAGLPSGVGIGDFLLHMNFNSSVSFQIAYDYNNGSVVRTWQRRKLGGSWTAWDEAGNITPLLDGADSDLNSLTPQVAGVVWHKLSGTISNGPIGQAIGAGDLVQTARWNATTGIQTLYNWSGTGGPVTTWRRALYSGGWTPWRCTDGLGHGQTWQDVTASRQANVAYQNTTGRPICVSPPLAHGAWFEISVDGVAWLQMHLADVNQDYGRAVGSVIVPPGHYYRVTGSLHSSNPWVEMR